MNKKAIQVKSELVSKITDDLKKAKSFIVFEYRGLKALDITELRFNLFKTKSKLFVLKNNILSRSLQNANFTDIIDEIYGPNAIIMGFEDELAPLKEVYELSKKFDFVKIKGAYLDSKSLNADEIKSLATIPSREGLYSMLLSCLTSPIRSVLYGLKAITEKQDK